ncbi:MAG TPA: dihydrolipoamide acetyltransferase family protein [Fimbriimonadaceae bacterium]|jgi:pyruvate/2-oxoglutarate dehydrogenase complex dihydrolipoamide acyltransferase (E2) component
MSVEILMPELGESVHEGTVSRWLKKEGDFVKEDEPIVEIMTDKVNTELPSPATGILSKILIPEGSLVEVFHAMGVIEEAGSDGAVSKAAAVEAPKAPVETPKVEQPTVASSAAPSDTERKWFTPLVRAMAKQHGISEDQLSRIRGTGEGGRVTKRDIESFIKTSVPLAPLSAKPISATKAELKPMAPAAAGPDQELVQLSGLRKMIADAMVRSSQVPTVSTVNQVDVTAMVKFRELNRESFQTQYGVKLTYTPFFIKALTETLLEFPLVNASLQSDNSILMTKGVHIGVAVALGQKGDEGLIVPVIRDCHKKNLIEIAKDLDLIAKKARSNSLDVNDVKGGTFTLTNPGTYGALFGTPMINAPQAGILGAYAIQKLPVIVDDMIAIRSIMHLVLTYDHRLVDGLVAGKFLAGVRDRLQNFDFFK